MNFYQKKVLNMKDFLENCLHYEDIKICSYLKCFSDLASCIHFDGGKHQ